MTTTVSGSYPAVNSDSDATINGLTVGKGTGGVSNNTAVGASALSGSNSGSGQNTAIGANALQSNTTGTNNVGVGYLAGNANQTGQANVMVGVAAGYNNTASWNTAVGGGNTFYANTSGTANTAVGGGDGINEPTMRSNTTGYNNTALGVCALASNTTAYNNTAVGYKASYSNTTGTNNVALGYQALDVCTTGEYNTAIGADALGSLTTPNDNTAVGYQAGVYSTALTTGSQNVLLGAYTRTSASNSTYQFVIGYDVAGQANNNVTIGSASGKIYNAFTSNATWTQTSDGRLKKNIQNETLGLSFINRLKPVKYEWKASNELDKDNPYYAEKNNRTTGVVMHGLVAQDVKAALDAEGINTFAGWDEGTDGIQSISREMFISPLIKAIQELNAKVDAQAIEIAQLKGN